jgi:hypothetical protein
MSKNLKKTNTLLICLCFFVSCTQITKNEDSADEVFGDKSFSNSIASLIVPKWFSEDSPFSLRKRSNKGATHMFYDISPDIDLLRNTVNFVVKTPEGSPFAYDLDLASGQHVLSKSLCVQSDVWKKYSETIYTPPFSLGVVPKILDQIGEAQKIIVFGDAKYYAKNFKKSFFSARIIGAFIEQICPLGGCFKPNEWKSRIVLIGVQQSNEKYQNVESVSELQKLVNWPLVKAFIENGQGVNQIVKTIYPAYRFGTIIPRDQALKYLDKNSTFLDNRKLITMRKSCHQLYNHIWKNVYVDSVYENKLKNFETINERAAFISSTKINKNSLFYKRFKNSFVDYSKEYKTCMKYIYPSNINKNVKRHWFFSYYTAVHLLNDLNYSFDCSRGSWIKNNKARNGQRIISLKDEFKKCNARLIDSAFELAVPFMDSLRKHNFKSYRYVAYDNKSFGTHNKIYSWVLDDNKSFYCDKDPEYSVELRMKTFPKDVKWKRKRLKFNRKGYIIK